MKNCLILLLGLISMQIQGQTLRFDVFQGIPVKQNGLSKSNAWAGGMNAMQYQRMDLNGDGVMDLVTFDRTSQQISTFLQDSAGAFTFAPHYIAQFPRIENWFVLVDYNQDGFMDLFCATGAGIKVYQNKTSLGQFRFEKVQDPIYSQGFAGLINLYVAAPDIPVIADVDGDGDVDVLAFEPGGHYIEFHENVSIQKSGKADLAFEKSSQNWGNIVHNDCQDAQIVNSDIRSEAVSQPRRVDHVGNALGRTASNDLFMGHVSCSNLTYLKNQGTNAEVNYSNFDFDFLRTYPAVSGIFMAAMPLQLTGNREDLFVSVNTSDNAGFLQDFQHSSFRMKEGQVTPFLQDQMIDVGEKASPCMVDVDSDGDLDLLIGHAGYRNSNDVRAGIYLFENQAGEFIFKTADYVGLASRESLTDIVIQNQHGQVLVVGQSSFGPKVFNISNQQLQVINLDLTLGETPVMSPWGTMVLSKAGRLVWGSNADWGQLRKESWELRTCQFADLDGDGTVEFIGIDLEGMWHIGNYEAGTNSLVWRTADFQGFTVGRNTRLSVADLNADGRVDLVVGTGAGGVYLLENKSSLPVWDALDTQTLQVWPNPTAGIVYVLANQSGELQVYNQAGQVISIKTLQAGKTFEFIHADMSLLRFVDATGKVSTRKIQHN
ncbi:T9SS type A sorting domain-containing protein [Aquirufa regiilacus]|uniref:T9SS type A sorting domain-containing protein n=1 Tax=Aquirufa regiilacus TaxID=3024868 RepID=A0ABU3TUL3_9BACT|nr:MULTISPECIES: T9SS type A sorting domain-containing protein [unclassified Aquirufa]MDT8888275.1 T9SS type A sorting domain-containing protein [Aquirufa sp. LEPPI-3A]MDU0809569.1 T9SS type A sorting domain-containing protein [Aquirufa sp. LEOWEIH-7C]